MMRTRILLLAAMMALGLTLGLATGCSKTPTPAADAQAGANAAAAGSLAADEAKADAGNIAAPAPAPAVDAPSEAADESAATKAVTESAGTDPGDPAQAGAKADPKTATKADLGQDIVLAANATDKPAVAKPAPRTDWKYPEGDYYSVLPTAQGTSSPPGKIEVAEIFWYGCPHCYHLEPLIKDWVQKLPSDVNFVRIPVMWNPTNEIHARVFYTAEALGDLDVINTAMFRAIHVDNKPMADEDSIRKLFEANGVSADDFNRTFRSFAVDSKLKRARELTVNYRVQGVPLLVIDGKYTTNGPKIRNQQDLLAVASELIERERQDR